MDRFVRCALVGSILGSILATLACGGGSGATVSPLAIATSSLPNGTIGTNYSQTISATGGVTPFQWTFTGTLPDNVTLGSSSGSSVALSGLPDQVQSAIAFYHFHHGLQRQFRFAGIHHQHPECARHRTDAVWCTPGCSDLQRPLRLSWSSFRRPASGQPTLEGPTTSGELEGHS